MKRPRWFVETTLVVSTATSASIRLRFFVGKIADAAAVAADPGNARDSEEKARFERFRDAIVSANGGSAAYVRRDMFVDAAFSIECQRDHLVNPHRWYGMRVTYASLTPTTLATLRRLLKHDGGNWVTGAIAKLRASHVVYVETAHEYVPCGIPALIDETATC